MHNHLSLFLCVADYDKLLPGWSHFAQFTIAVVNKDPKKSKYSDTLHRFCKKEHDWGWKKFMELSKVLDGFTVADTLVIKAQVQVIHEKPARPFRCLEPQYRRELVRVYLTNVEGICRRFLEEKREALLKTKEDAERWQDMRAFLSSEEGVKQARQATERADALMKGVVKRFFNEKEVTSTLVMDALYCGCRALDVGDMPPAEAAKLTSKPNRAVWLSISQNKVRFVFHPLRVALFRRLDAKTHARDVLLELDPVDPRRVVFPPDVQPPRARGETHCILRTDASILACRRLKTSGSIRLFVERARGTRDFWGFFFFTLIAALATHSLTSSRSFPIPILRETPKPRRLRRARRAATCWRLWSAPRARLRLTWTRRIPRANPLTFPATRRSATRGASPSSAGARWRCTLCTTCS